MSKPRKKYNPQKAAAQKSRTLLRNYVAAFITGDKYGGHVVLFNVHTNQIVTKPTAEVHRLLTEVPQLWTMYTAVHSVKELYDFSLKKEMHYEVLGTNSPYYHSELITTFNEMHQRLIKSVNQGRVIGAGWLASVNNHQLSKDKVMDIFIRLGAYDSES